MNQILFWKLVFPDIFFDKRISETIEYINLIYNVSAKIKGLLDCHLLLKY